MIPVLAYHKVNPTPRSGEPPSMCVHPARFAEQIAALADQGFRTIAPRAFVASVSGEDASLPERPILITFDDGYRDNHEHALPVLRAHRFSATVFLIGDYLPEAQGFLRPRPAARPEVPMLGPEEIAELLSAGFSFGSHSMSHRRLTALPDEELDWELRASREAVARVAGCDADLFSYPYGDHDARAAAAVRSAGYRAAFTMRKGPVRQGADPFALRRIPVGPEDTGRTLCSRLSPWRRTAEALSLRTAEIGRRLLPL